MNHLSYGALGESLAQAYLEKKGYKILERNYSNAIGELDIIALDGLILVFVEVKTRKNRAFGYAFEAVNERKQDKIRKTSLMYLQEKNLAHVQCRFDVVEVYPDEKEPCRHFVDAFW